MPNRYNPPAPSRSTERPVQRDAVADLEERRYDRMRDEPQDPSPAANRGFSGSDALPARAFDEDDRRPPRGPGTYGGQSGAQVGYRGDMRRFQGDDHVDRDDLRGHDPVDAGRIPGDAAPRVDHRGKGPRGYQRSDARIVDDINDALTDDSLIDATDVTVRVSNGEVTLTGTVSDRAAKYRADELIERIAGVHDVDNRLEIHRAATLAAAARASDQQISDAHDAADEPTPGKDPGKRFHA